MPPRVFPPVSLLLRLEVWKSLRRSWLGVVVLTVISLPFLFLVSSSASLSDSDSCVSGATLLLAFNVMAWFPKSWSAYFAMVGRTFPEVLTGIAAPRGAGQTPQATSHPQARGEAGVRLRFRHVRASSDASGFPRSLTESSPPFASHRRCSSTSSLVLETVQLLSRRHRQLVANSLVELQ